MIDPLIIEDSNPWHFKKSEIGHYNEQCYKKTKYIIGNKKKEILSNTKEVKKIKMMKQANFIKVKKGLGFHLMRCLQNCQRSKVVFNLLWNRYFLHCLGDHRFCIDEHRSLSFLRDFVCAREKQLLCLDDNKKFRIL